LIKSAVIAIEINSEHWDFHETLRRLTPSPIQRYSTEQEKRWFKKPTYECAVVNRCVHVQQGFEFFGCAGYEQTRTSLRRRGKDA
jgi:hypothetical protein